MTCSNDFFRSPKSANSGPGQGRLKLKFFSSLRKNIESLKLNHQTSHWARYYKSPTRNTSRQSCRRATGSRNNQAVSKIS
jgi:hypothetical protein